MKSKAVQNLVQMNVNWEHQRMRYNIDNQPTDRHTTPVATLIRAQWGINSNDSSRVVK